MHSQKRRLTETFKMYDDWKLVSILSNLNRKQCAYLLQSGAGSGPQRKETDVIIVTKFVDAGDRKSVV